MPLSRALIDALKQRVKKRKKKGKQLHAPSFPKSAELEYKRALISLSRETSDLIRKKVWPLIQQQRQDANTPVPVMRTIEALRVQIAEEVSSKAQGVAGKMVSRTGEDSRKALNASYKRVTGIEPWGSNSGLAPSMAEAIKRNVALIQSIPNQQLDQVQATITEAFSSGLPVGDLQDQLEERFSVSESRAELIARDQVGKLNAEFNQERQEQIGVNSYIWQSSNDERTRPMHRELDGQQFEWDNPPITNEQGDRNNPGEDYQCRCNAIANIEDVLTKLGI